MNKQPAKALTWSELVRIKADLNAMEKEGKNFYDGYSAATQIPKMIRTIEKLYDEVEKLREEATETKETLLNLGKEMKDVEELRETKPLLNTLVLLVQRFIKDYHTAPVQNKDFPVNTFTAEIYKLLCPFLMQYKVTADSCPKEIIVNRPTQTITIADLNPEPKREPKKDEEIGG